MPSIYFWAIIVYMVLLIGVGAIRSKGVAGQGLLGGGPPTVGVCRRADVEASECPQRDLPAARI